MELIITILLTISTIIGFIIFAYGALNFKDKLVIRGSLIMVASVVIVMIM